ncbi:basic salivary proline-rich protein 2-like [Homarus americanus]|uniref:basic salivary proline-rich protein 2-like n=1 Tax=Homarus americanus TaxID=6706 RepID=UPI001C485ED7|nr:basic salivary proline-rich protein 2-like [Homarus americanus]
MVAIKCPSIPELPGEQSGATPLGPLSGALERLKAPPRGGSIPGHSRDAGVQGSSQGRRKQGAVQGRPTRRATFRAAANNGARPGAAVTSRDPPQRGRATPGVLTQEDGTPACSQRGASGTFQVPPIENRAGGSAPRGHSRDVRKPGVLTGGAARAVQGAYTTRRATFRGGSDSRGPDQGGSNLQDPPMVGRRPLGVSQKIAPQRSQGRAVLDLSRFRGDHSPLRCNAPWGPSQGIGELKGPLPERRQRPQGPLQRPAGETRVSQKVDLPGDASGDPRGPQEDSTPAAPLRGGGALWDLPRFRGDHSPQVRLSSPYTTQGYGAQTTVPGALQGSATDPLAYHTSGEMPLGPSFRGRRDKGLPEEAAPPGAIPGTSETRGPSQKYCKGPSKGRPLTRRPFQGRQRTMGPHSGAAVTSRDPPSER